MPIKEKEYSIECHCGHAKKLPLKIKVDTDSEDSPKIELDCPYQHLEGCAGTVTVTLPHPAATTEYLLKGGGKID